MHNCRQACHFSHFSYKEFIFLLILFWASLLSLSVQAKDEASLSFSLINTRLSYMKDIAAFKAEKNINVYDGEREQSVLEKSKEQASQIGLDPESVMAFFTAQMNAAKVIQYRWLAEWQSEPLSVTYKPRDLTKDIRPALIVLGEEIIISIHAYLIAGHQFTPAMEKQFIQSISTEQLSVADKKILFQSLCKIKLKET